MAPGSEQVGRPLAVVTGASTGIGYELARICAMEGYDLVIAADEPQIHDAARVYEGMGVKATAIEADLSTVEGVDRLCAAAKAVGKPVSALFANAGRALGGSFLDQDFGEARKVLDTNLLGTIYLLHRIGGEMRSRNEGRILVTGSIAGFMPGTDMAVYNGTKAFINSFSAALRQELADTNVTVTCLMPGGTDTEVFKRAGMDETLLANSPLSDPADVARVGYDAMMRGDGDIVEGLMNKVMSAVANVVPAPILAAVHGKAAEPGGAKG